jgi:hypothetical protein
MNYSPVLSIATAAFEIAIAGWAISIRFMAESRRIIDTTVAILLLLAGYQIAEVAICSNVAVAGFLPRLAFIIVTWLPALGLLLIARLRRPGSRATDRSAYAMLAAAAGIVVWILVDRSFACASVCNAVYARYTHVMPRFLVYSSFYWLGLAGMIVCSAYGAMTSRDALRRRQLLQLLVGTLAFVVPAITVSWFVPPARGALPSIMCHFALLLAVGLARLIHLEREPAGEIEEAPVVNPG